MALFKKDEKEQVAETKEQVTGTNEQVTGDDFLNSFAGQGLENFTQETVSTSYLGMIQPDSTAAQDNEPGQWIDTATNEPLGPEVEVIPVAFQTVWSERDSEPPFTTVGRYLPNSIEVEIQRPKNGKGFPIMTNPKTGNKIQELFIYGVILKNHLEAGIYIFSPTAGSMKTCKKWNSLLRSQRLPNGAMAPLFAFSWKLKLDLVTNPKQPSKKIAKFVSMERGSLVTKELFEQTIQPILKTAQNLAMLAAPASDDDIEE